ncbi:MAG: hypothetical protein PHS09_07210 [Candidatus Omnitrophica bacterium]|nr:hypothetical protein [Candidatus Omnitrophota bacterium]
MSKILLSPPLAFMIIFGFCLFLSFIFSRLAFRNKKEKPPGAGKSYACGEDIADHMAQPDYSQFFPFAFFFTIVHVATLMVTTIPVENAETFITAITYVISVVVALLILFRR